MIRALIVALLLTITASSYAGGADTTPVDMHVWPQWMNRIANMDAVSSWFPADDQCACLKLPIYGQLADVDQLHYRIQALDNDDLAEMGLYSEDGATQYFEGDLVVTSAGDKYVANELSPVATGRGALWVCLAIEDVSADGIGFTLGRGVDTVAASDDWFPTIFFQQTCTGGELPATLTVPGTLSYDEPGAPSEMPFFRFNDDPTS